MQHAKRPGTNQLERKIHVPDSKSEDHTDQPVVRERIDDAAQALARAVVAESDDEVSGLERHHSKRAIELREIARQIGVGIKRDLVPASFESRTQRLPQPAITVVMDDDQVRPRLRERLEDWRRPILAAVVDDNDLEFNADVAQDALESLDTRFDACFFVIRAA